MKKAQPAKSARAAHNVAGKQTSPQAAVAKSAARKLRPTKQATLKQATSKKSTIKKVAIEKVAAKKSAAKKATSKTPALTRGKPAAKRPAAKHGVTRKAAPRKHAAPKTIDDYIVGFPAEVQARLQQVRATIRQAAPDAQEIISYQMPAFTQQGNLIYFAGYEHHIGIYPAPRAIEQFKQELAAYEGGKGTIKLPHDRPLPLDLIRRIVEFKVRLNLEKGAAKRRR